MSSDPQLTLKQNKLQNKLSEAYFEIIVRLAGYNPTPPEDDDHGIDYYIRAPRQEDPTGRLGVDVQLKSVREDELRGKGDSIVYDCPSLNYNDLISTNALTPRILILVIVPADIDTWISITEERLMMEFKARYLSLKGKKESENSRSQKIDIPQKNIFNVDTLKQIMAKGGNQ